MIESIISGLFSIIVAILNGIFSLAKDSFNFSGLKSFVRSKSASKATDLAVCRRDL